MAEKDDWRTSFCGPDLSILCQSTQLDLDAVHRQIALLQIKLYFVVSCSADDVCFAIWGFCSTGDVLQGFLDLARSPAGRSSGVAYLPSRGFWRW